MGTSSSYPGRRNGKPLLPPGHTPMPYPIPPVPHDPQPQPNDPLQPPKPNLENTPLNSPANAWANTRRAFTSLAKAFGAGVAGVGMQRVARNYTRASGGSKVLGASAISGQQGLQRLGGFLATASSQGVPAAARAIGAGDLTDASSDVVLCRLVDALAPAPNSLEESWTRSAMTRTIEEWQNNADLFGEDGAITTPEQSKELMTNFIANYANERFEQEVCGRLDDGILPMDEALKLLEHSREYILNTIRAGDQFEHIDPATFVWEGADGKALAESALVAAYALLEDAGVES